MKGRFSSRNKVSALARAWLPFSASFLLFIDRAIKAQLEETTQECRALQYVDNYLVIRPDFVPSDFIVEAFTSCSSRLTFTREPTT